MEKKRVLIVGASSALGREVVRQLYATGDYEIHGTHSGRRSMDCQLAIMLSSVTIFNLEDGHDMDVLACGTLLPGLQFEEIYYFIGVASAGYGARTTADREYVLRVNHVLAMQVLRAVGDKYLAQGGRLIVASSAAAWWNLEYAPGYCRAKNRLNESLNELAADGIQVTCWAPGAIATDLWAAPGIPKSVQALVRWLAPSPLWAVRHLLRYRQGTSAVHDQALLLLTTVDAWLSYHVPSVAWAINLVLSGLVELDGYFAAKATRLTPRAIVVLPIYALGFFLACLER